MSSTGSTRDFTATEADDWDIVRRYDTLMYDPAHDAYFSGSDFTNFGYWRADTKTQKQACENLMEELVGKMPEKRGRILDVACGKGATTRHLMRHFDPAGIVGINISEKQLDTARNNAPGCAFELMDATDLRFDDASFDYVLCVEAAFHFDTRERFFKQALRVLRPGGRLILTDILATEEAERSKPYRLAANFVENLEAYAQVARRAGFDEVQVDDVTEACWHGCYWHAVRTFHRQFLDGRFDQASLSERLRLTYRRQVEITHYLLSVLSKRVER